MNEFQNGINVDENATQNEFEGLESQEAQENSFLAEDQQIGPLPTPEEVASGEFHAEAPQTESLAENQQLNGLSLADESLSEIETLQPNFLADNIKLDELKLHDLNTVEGVEEYIAYLKQDTIDHPENKNDNDKTISAAEKILEQLKQQMVQENPQSANMPVETQENSFFAENQQIGTLPTPEEVASGEFHVEAPQTESLAENQQIETLPTPEEVASGEFHAEAPQTESLAENQQLNELSLAEEKILPNMQFSGNLANVELPELETIQSNFLAGNTTIGELKLHDLNTVEGVEEYIAYLKQDTIDHPENKKDNKHKIKAAEKSLKKLKKANAKAAKKGLFGKKEEKLEQTEINEPKGENLIEKEEINKPQEEILIGKEEINKPQEEKKQESDEDKIYSWDTVESRQEYMTYLLQDAIAHPENKGKNDEIIAKLVRYGELIDGVKTPIPVITTAPVVEPEKVYNVNTPEERAAFIAHLEQDSMEHPENKPANDSKITWINSFAVIDEDVAKQESGKSK